MNLLENLLIFSDSNKYTVSHLYSITITTLTSKFILVFVAASAFGFGADTIISGTLISFVWGVLWVTFPILFRPRTVEVDGFLFDN